jgi:hypothetical protein
MVLLSFLCFFVAFFCGKKKRTPKIRKLLVKEMARLITELRKNDASYEIIAYTCTFTPTTSYVLDFGPLAYRVASGLPTGFQLETSAQKNERKALALTSTAGSLSDVGYVLSKTVISYDAHSKKSILQGCCKYFDHFSIKEWRGDGDAVVGDGDAVVRKITTKEALTQLFDVAYRIGTSRKEGATFMSTTDDSAILGLHTSGALDEDSAHLPPGKAPSNEDFNGTIDSLIYIHGDGRTYADGSGRLSKMWEAAIFTIKTTDAGALVVIKYGWNNRCEIEMKWRG